MVAGICRARDVPWIAGSKTSEEQGSRCYWRACGRLSGRPKIVILVGPVVLVVIVSGEENLQAIVRPEQNLPSDGLRLLGVDVMAGLDIPGVAVVVLNLERQTTGCCIR